MIWIIGTGSQSCSGEKTIVARLGRARSVFIRRSASDARADEEARGGETAQMRILP